jgi:hypothetical protein
MQAFEGVACTDSRGSFAFLFLIMLAISLAGMFMVMLRAGMYPYKQVFPLSSLDDDEDELEEYRAYLQYVSPFLNMWGGNTDGNGDLFTKTGTYETSSEMTNMSVSPSALAPRSFHKAQQLDYTSMCENEVKIPFSPLGSRFTFDQSRMYSTGKIPFSPLGSRFTFDQSPMYDAGTNSTSRDDSNDGCTPLTPHTSSVHSSDKQCRRFTTLDSPLVLSAMRQHTWVNCFANFVSPKRIGNRSGDKSE